MSFDEVKTQTLTGSATYSGTVQAPVDGYRAYASTVYTGLQELINNDVYFSQNDIRNTDQIVLVPVSSGATYIDYSSTNGAGWLQNATYNRMEQVDITKSKYCWFDLPYHYNTTAYVKSIEVGLLGEAGHGALPSNMPYFALQNENITTGVIAARVGTTYDTSASTAIYEAYHIVSATYSSGSRLQINPSLYRSVLVIEGESGPNALNGLQLCSIKVTYTYTA